MAKEETGALVDFKSAVVVAAAEAVIKEMEPAQMKAIMEETIGKALERLSSSYGDLTQLVEAKGSEVMEEYLKTPDVQKRLREAVHNGVDMALGKLPEEIKGKLMDVAMSGMVKSLEAKQRGY